VRYAHVAGVITLDGTPLEGGQVVLLCEEVVVQGPRPSSRGVSDEAGRFTLRSVSPEKKVVEGAVVGWHHVAISTQMVEQDDQDRTRVVREELLGPEYTQGEKLTVEVPADGIADWRIELSSE